MLDLIQVGRCEQLKHADDKGLRRRGIDAVEDNVSTSAFHRRRVTVGKEPFPCTGELCACIPLGRLHALSGCMIGKEHCLSIDVEQTRG
ncbi:MAG TPA: hypothetical protein VMU48_18715 [Terracidiphilus sp.]|nr:hypothetical protein [Terracidiphilus sp.]